MALNTLILLVFTLTTHSAHSTEKFDIPMSYNKEVDRWLKAFKRNEEAYFKSWLKKSKKKIPKIKGILSRNGLPKDLAYLPIIESGLNSHAVSSASAVGYWQFMAPTAKQYHLNITWWIDERRDLIKSTWAASQYLKDLYGMFGHWYLALSAYNMGENRLKKLIRRHQDDNFWSLSKKRGFPKETKDYVPKFLAATLITKSPVHYGFKKPVTKKDSPYSYHYVPGGTDLRQIAQRLNISRETLKQLNPELNFSFIPNDVRAHRIRVPKDFGHKVSRLIAASKTDSKVSSF